MVNLNTDLLVELGNTISEKISDLNSNGTTLLLKVDSYSFKKIDEEIFFRFQNEDKKESYIPSDDEIILHFSNLDIKIEKEKNIGGVIWNKAKK